MTGVRSWQLTHRSELLITDDKYYSAPVPGWKLPALPY